MATAPAVSKAATKIKYYFNTLLKGRCRSWVPLTGRGYVAVISLCALIVSVAKHFVILTCWWSELLITLQCAVQASALVWQRAWAPIAIALPRPLVGGKSCESRTKRPNKQTFESSKLPALVITIIIFIIIIIFGLFNACSVRDPAISIYIYTYICIYSTLFCSPFNFFSF